MYLVFANLPFSLECIRPNIGAIQWVNIWILFGNRCHPFLHSPMRNLSLLCLTNRWRRTNERRTWKELLSTRYVQHLVTLAINIGFREVHTWKSIRCFTILVAVCRDGFKVLIQCFKITIPIKIIRTKITRGLVHLLSSKLIRTHDVLVRRRNACQLYRVALILGTWVDVHVRLGVDPLLRS
jgi:hypothetical protein